MLTSAARSRLLPALARATSRPDVNGAGKVLVVQPDHLGDILLSEPAVRYLRSQLPDAELIAVVGPWSAEVVRMAWLVDHIVEVEFPGFTRQAEAPNPVAPYRQLRREILRLRELDADDALILRDDAWWAAWMSAGAVGRDVITSPSAPTSTFATRTAKPGKSAHRTALALDVVGSYLTQRRGVGLDRDWDMSPQLRHDWQDMAPGPRTNAGTVARSQYVVVHPGSGADVKSWPVRSWRWLIRHLGDTEVILTGSAGERDLCEEIAAACHHTTVIAGATSLSQLAHLLQGAAVAIGTDNGPMHLAGALGTPTVRLFGPSNPERYGPWSEMPGQTVVSAGWSCPRCEDLSQGRAMTCGCMTAISPQRVLQVARDALAHAA